MVDKHQCTPSVPVGPSAVSVTRMAFLIAVLSVGCLFRPEYAVAPAGLIKFLLQDIRRRARCPSLHPPWISFAPRPFKVLPHNVTGARAWLRSLQCVVSAWLRETNYCLGAWRLSVTNTVMRALASQR